MTICKLLLGCCGRSELVGGASVGGGSMGDHQPCYKCVATYPPLHPMDQMEECKFMCCGGENHMQQLQAMDHSEAFGQHICSQIREMRCISTWSHDSHVTNSGACVGHWCTLRCRLICTGTCICMTSLLACVCCFCCLHCSHV